jgi:hypothetical protein
MNDLFVHVHPVLGPEVMLAKKEPMVRGHDESGILPEVALIEVIEKLSKQEVAKRDDRANSREFLGFGPRSSKRRRTNRESASFVTQSRRAYSAR